MCQNISDIQKDKLSYTEFIKKFSVLREQVKINDDEFDNIFYTHGLKLYENVPLIEPLEYKDEHTLYDFVIAIDTSGSTSGYTVKQFLKRTYSILKNNECSGKQFNIHIIQCDAMVQQDVVIRNMDELEDYIKNLRLFGFGGTDFRPVFNYVDELIKSGAFTNLGGLIYFTDGYGTYPSRPPKYKTAFAFVDQCRIPIVPPWAMKVVWKGESYEY